MWTGYMTAVVKLRPGAPDTMADTLSRVARALDGRVAIESGTLARRVQGLLSERRLILGVLAVFSVTALLLVCLGVYGLVSFAVAERTREIAVRAALLLRRVLDAMVVDVTTADPLVYFGAAVLLVVVALVAAFLPSLRAARLDPLEALRRE
jgi:putative ABC transport system permease protein